MFLYIEMRKTTLNKINIHSLLGAYYIFQLIVSEFILDVLFRLYYLVHRNFSEYSFNYTASPSIALTASSFKKREDTKLGIFPS
jgi:hypothetical protein